MSKYFMNLKAESETYGFEKPKSSKNQCCSFFCCSSRKPLKDYGHASVVEGKKPLMGQCHMLSSSYIWVEKWPLLSLMGLVVFKPQSVEDLASGLMRENIHSQTCVSVMTEGQNGRFRDWLHQGDFNCGKTSKMRAQAQVWENIQPEFLN